MIEPEVAYCDLDGLMELAEQFLSHIVGSVLKNRGPELEVIGRDKAKLEAILPPFPRLRYDAAVEMLNQAHKDGHLEAPFEYGNDFGSPDETWLSSQFDRPVMVNRYPADVKAFYMEPDPKDAKFALCVDVLAPEGYGEIIGGSQRVSSYDLLLSRIEAHKLPREAFEWYLDLRRYGSVPHAGFGMGIERAVAWICGLDAAQDVSVNRKWKSPGKTRTAAHILRHAELAEGIIRLDAGACARSHCRHRRALGRQTRRSTQASTLRGREAPCESRRSSAPNRSTPYRAQRTLSSIPQGPHQS
jgi:aspartyl/asparaginyl-tRNA synthetase